MLDIVGVLNDRMHYTKNNNHWKCMNGKLKKDKIDVIHLWRRYDTLHLRQKGGLFSLRQMLYGNPLDEDKLHSAKPGPEE